ncbi:MAG TPA: hypothetical protein VND19_23165 [Acetobacteraceae bacterium]|nr:hypothetical protein [Acetobacteraceae bacterium]
MASPDLAPQDHCFLQHRLFSRFGDPLFRRSETDGTPVMVVLLGEREAALPLRALQREFNIPDEAEDGRMLALIAASLDFVTSLRLGDALPAEVLTGDASWEPTRQHLRLANARLQLQLVAWLRAGTGEDHVALDSRALLTAADDPALRQQVQEAFKRVADELKLPATEAVVPMMESLAQELAYVEALRERLLQPVQGVAAKLVRLAQSWRGDAKQLETLTQVRRLTGVALRGIGSRFEELDAQTGEVLAALRNPESQRTFIRSNRDWLYRTQRAWQPLLLEWDSIGFTFELGTRAVLDHSYRFLAPRFMPVTEWISATRSGAGAKPKAQDRGMVW